MPLADILGGNPKFGPEVYLLFLWGWTTMMCFVFAYTEWRKLRDAGLLGYLLEMVYVGNVALVSGKQLHSLEACQARTATKMQTPILRLSRSARGVRSGKRRASCTTGRLRRIARPAGGGARASGAPMQ